MTCLSIQSDHELTDKKQQAIVGDIRETIEYTGGYISYSDEGLMQYDCDTRWDIPVHALVELAKKHDVKIRAIGREDGCGFIQVVCIAASGDVVQDDCINYAF